MSEDECSSDETSSDVDVILHPGILKGTDPDGYDGCEIKYWDLEKAETALSYGVGWHNTELDFTTGGDFWSMPQGYSAYERIGTSVDILRLVIRGTIFIDDNYQVSAGVRAPQVRLILYIDKSTNGLQMQGEEVMLGSSLILSPVSLDTFQDPASVGKAVIIHDEKFVFNGWPSRWSTLTNLVINDGYTLPFLIDHEFKPPLRVHFKSGVYGAIDDYSCHLLGKTDYNGLPIYIRYCSRAYFIDP